LKGEWNIYRNMYKFHLYEYESGVTSNKRGREFSIINIFENKILIHDYNTVKLVVDLFMFLDNITILILQKF